ncbi:P-loop containing nucleoside triphosphate hydrolase protein, partial [Nadsonia fulvescens var. elongata DSM 6958]
MIMKELKEDSSNEPENKIVQLLTDSENEISRNLSTSAFDIISDSDNDDDDIIKIQGSIIVQQDSPGKSIKEGHQSALNLNTLPLREDTYLTKEIDIELSQDRKDIETRCTLGITPSKFPSKIESDDRKDENLTIPPPQLLVHSNDETCEKSPNMKTSNYDINRSCLLKCPGTPTKSRNSSSRISEANSDQVDIYLTDFTEQKTLSRSNSVTPDISQPSVEKKKCELTNISKILSENITGTIPLAEQTRPTELDDFIGQDQLMGRGGILRSLIEQDEIPSMILWGPCGVGKTTLARIIAQKTKSRFIELSATHLTMNGCHRVFDQARKEKITNCRETILFLDEIHSFSKTQQDVLLPAVENGDIILIGATTENPSLKVANALTSRCKVFTLNTLTESEIYTVLQRALSVFNEKRRKGNLREIKFDEDSLKYFLEFSNGDGRFIISTLEMTIKHFLYLESKSQKKAVLEYPNISECVINIKTTKVLLASLRVKKRKANLPEFLSAIRNSIRGSNADAALYYLNTLILSEQDPTDIADCFIRIAMEDIGNADESCLSFASSTQQVVYMLGMPEAEMALANCCVKLAQAPKGKMVYQVKEKVKNFLIENDGASSASVPLHLKNAPNELMKRQGHGKGYKYNPDYIDGKVK